jgi:hypothetical protein
MHKLYGLALAGAFIVGLMLPHTAHATFGRMCEAENPQCGTGPGTGGSHDDGPHGGGNAGGADPMSPTWPATKCWDCNFDQNKFGDCVEVTQGWFGCDRVKQKPDAGMCIGRPGAFGWGCHLNGDGEHYGIGWHY